MAELSSVEIKDRLQKVTPRGYSSDEMRAFRIGLMIGARAPEFGPLLESYVAGLKTGASAEHLELEIRALADILVAPPLRPA